MPLRRLRRCPGHVVAMIAVAAIGAMLPVGTARSQESIDPCTDLPAREVEEVLAARGVRARVSESISLPFETQGTCTHLFGEDRLRLQLIAIASPAASELRDLFGATPRPDGAVAHADIGDEAFRYATSGTNGMMFRAGRIMATIELRGTGRGLDAAVVELGRRWAARITGVRAPGLVVMAPDSPAPPPAQAEPHQVVAASDAAVESSDADMVPDCGPGITGICVPDEPALEALAIAEAIEDDDRQQIEPVIRDAVLSAGFPILEYDGSTTPSTATPSQGIAIHAWELQGVAAMVARGMSTPLDTVAASLAALFQVSDSRRVAALLLEGIRSQATSEHASSRTWARLIASLGEQRQGFDLLGRVAAERVELDGLQLLLITRRLAGDLAAAAGAPASRHGALPREMPLRLASVDALGHRRAARDLAVPPPVVPGWWVPALRTGCAPSETESYIGDWAAIGFTTAFGGVHTFGGVVGMLQDGLGGKAGSAIGKYGSSLSIANHLLAFFRLVLTYSSIEAGLELDGSGPLVRTRSTRTPGERRTIRGTLRMNIDDAQWFNCARLALNQVGLDFSVPNGGPMSGVETWWRLEEGGVVGASSGRGIDYGVVQFAAGQLSERRFTDADGSITVALEGKPQRHEVSPAARAVEKHAAVRMEVKLKSSDLIKELPDIVGTALSFASSPIGIAIEMYYRSRVPVQALRIPVRDWSDRVRFRITSVGMTTGGPCFSERIKASQGPLQEVYEVVVDHEGATVVARRTAELCDQYESTAEDADLARCEMRGSYEAPMRLTGLHGTKAEAHYMWNGRPTRRALKVSFVPRTTTRAALSGNCTDEIHEQWRASLEQGFSSDFPLMPPGDRSVRSISAYPDGTYYLLEVLEGDLGTFEVR